MASKNIGLSVALAVYNEEKNLERCLSSVGDIADEIVVVDGGSTDGTAHIAKAAGATVIQAVNPEIFHVNKQKAIANCHREWILQLDADEQVSVALAQEIRRVLNMSDVQRSTRQIDSRKKILFERHQKIVEDRDGKIGGNTGIITAYFIPRLNYFLGQPIRHAGTYPDGVIRLVKNGFAHFPAKSVHEQIEIKGRVSWLENDLWHFSNPTLKKYLTGARK
ncbi:hypothetical protein A2154_01530 [Candidatus Gottesmanbacteria bacterium RBG_16_43_7]|uniref:Glycosyltransferase 2-like domain-containing protein n=1 Tax=Candidatus Gottesmanbacteria bacterium RBG_16_43_7 TaxID=1798373 RepID=A0A1F5Z7F0_9BACT|nr:MAG: hypothetical protein A2154_01530 [Candidatus Gottesmanbacteria bacterium RBG_16_43_7]